MKIEYIYYGDDMLDPNKYISRKEYCKLFPNEPNSGSFFVLEAHNQNFIKEKLIAEKEYFDKLYSDIDHSIILDEEQRLAILNDEDYAMIIAGAGSGKTTTIAGKVKYLVDKLNILPNEIVILSYTNKAVNELKKIINEEFQMPAQITTFHKFAKLFIGNNIKINNNFKAIITTYINELITSNDKRINDIIAFYQTYLDVSLLYINTLKNKHIRKLLIKYYRLKTIKGEYVKNQSDVMIADTLFFNNIEYLYKTIFDFTWFEIKVNNQHYYLITIKNKLYFYNIISKFNDGLKIFVPFIKEDNYCYLIKELKKNKILKNDFSLQDYQRNIINLNSKKYYYFINFCETFIRLIKAYGENIFNDYQNTDERTSMFLTIIKDIYKYYKAYLKNENSIDFDDMIINATKECLHRSVVYKYIIIDEYQDISNNRFNLIYELSIISNAKIIVIGDDWQTIFSFAGSNLDLFLDFKNKFGYASELKINNTYRNSQQLIDIAGQFVMKNNNQIKKQLISLKRNNNPLTIIFYSNNIITALIKAIEELLSKYGLYKNILLVGRYSFDINIINKNNNFKKINDNLYQYKDYSTKIYFLTIHKAKGLGFDNVIILNAHKGLYGFPSMIEMDPIMKIFDQDIINKHLAEERRLFYVALTRTKNEVFILAPNKKYSLFIDEIKTYKNVRSISN